MADGQSLTGIKMSSLCDLIMRTPMFGLEMDMDTYYVEDTTVSDFFMMETDIFYYENEYGEYEMCTPVCGECSGCALRKMCGFCDINRRW